MKSKITLGAATMLAAAIALSGCSATSAGGGGKSPSKNEVTFSAISNFTGALAVQAIPIQALTARIASVNKDGGIDGTKIKMTTEDALGDPAREVQLIRNAANDSNVTAILGLGLSSQMEAAVPLVDKLKIPAISTPSVSTLNADYYYRAAANYPTTAKALGQFATEKFPNAKVAEITLDTPAPRASTAEFEKVVKAAGMQIVHSDFFPSTAPSLATETEAALAANPDILVINSISDPAMAKSMFDVLALKGNGIPTLWLSNGCSTQRFQQAVGPMYSACVSLPLTVTGVPAAKEMIDTLKENGAGDLMNSIDDSYAVQGFAVARILEAAIKDCNPKCDRESFAKALGKVDLPADGMTGRLTFDNADKNALNEIAMLYQDPVKKEITVVSDFKEYN